MQTRCARSRAVCSPRGCAPPWSGRFAARRVSPGRSRDARVSDLRAVSLERTLVLVKPDGVQRHLVGEVITRLERRAVPLVALKLMRIDHDLAQRHCAAPRGKPFFDGLIDFITSS